MIDQLKKFASRLPTHFLKSVHLDEVSLVDNPANQETNVTIYKRETPVNSMIWKEDTDEDEEEETEKMSDHKDKDEDEEKEVAKLRRFLRKMKEDEDEDEEKEVAKLRRHLRKMKHDEEDEEEDKEVSKRRLRRRVRKNYVPNVSYGSASAELSPEVQSVLKRMAATVDSQADELDVMREGKRQQDVLSKCASLQALPAPIERTAEVVEQMSKSLSERDFGRWYDYMEKLAKSYAVISGELGSNVPVQSGASAEIEKLAMQTVSKSGNVTKEQAIAKVLEEQPHLYNQYLMEERNG